MLRLVVNMFYSKWDVLLDRINLKEEKEPVNIRFFFDKDRKVIGEVTKEGFLLLYYDNRLFARVTSSKFEQIVYLNETYSSLKEKEFISIVFKNCCLSHMVGTYEYPFVSETSILYLREFTKDEFHSIIDIMDISKVELRKIHYVFKAIDETFKFYELERTDVTYLRKS